MHYFAVIFTSTLVNSEGYEEVAQRMDELARQAWYGAYKVRFARIEGAFSPL